MNQKITTQKIKVNNGQELIAKAKEYKNSGGEWKLREKYWENSSGTLGNKKRKRELGWGIVISNDQQTVDIFSTKGNLSWDAINNEVESRPELHQLFPEAEYSLFASDQKGGDWGDSKWGSRPLQAKLDEETFQMKVKESEEYHLCRYLVAKNSWHLSQIVHQWVQDNKIAIQQSSNSDFHSWVEIIDGQDGNMYLYVGKKNDSGGREIKIGIKKDKYFEKREGYNYNAEQNNFYNAGEGLEVNWDLMLITIDFAGWPLKFKERKNNNQPVFQSIKEKILRNLDKVCLDPVGEIANAEVLKSDEISDLYKEETLHESGSWEKLAVKVYQVEIEGEEIDLTQFVNGHWEDYNEIKNALIREIKQNPTEWKIEERKTDSWTIVKHKSGRRHWGHAFKYFREELEKTKRDWTEINTLLKGQPLPVEKISDNEKSQLLQYFLQNGIIKITLENGKLVIEYNGKDKKILESEDQEQQKYHQIIQNLPNKSLSLSELQSSNNSSNSSMPDKNNNLYAGLAFGVVGGIALTGIIALLLSRKKKNK